MSAFEDLKHIVEIAYKQFKQDIKLSYGVDTSLMYTKDTERFIVVIKRPEGSIGLIDSINVNIQKDKGCYEFIGSIKLPLSLSKQESDTLKVQLQNQFNYVGIRNAFRFKPDTVRDKEEFTYVDIVKQSYPSIGNPEVCYASIYQVFEYCINAGGSACVNTIGMMKPELLGMNNPFLISQRY